jgi:hypothetical protein
MMRGTARLLRRKEISGESHAPERSDAIDNKDFERLAQSVPTAKMAGWVHSTYPSDISSR